VRLSELVSRLTPTHYTELALVLFLVVFVVVGVRAFRRRHRDEFDQARMLPLADDTPAAGGQGGTP